MDSRFLKHLVAFGCWWLFVQLIMLGIYAIYMCVCDFMGKWKTCLSLFGQGWSSTNCGMQSQEHYVSLPSAAIRSPGCCLALYMLAVPPNYNNCLSLIACGSFWKCCMHFYALAWGHRTLLGEMSSTSGWATMGTTLSGLETCCARGFAFVF